MTVRSFCDSRPSCPAPDGQPDWAVVAARVSLPQFGTSATVNFVIDTGADGSVINQRDALRVLPVHYAPTRQVTLRGIEGTSGPYAVEPARLQFTNLEGYETTLTLSGLVLAHGDPLRGLLPSLLGRDVLQRFGLHLDHAARLVTLEFQG